MLVSPSFSEAVDIADSVTFAVSQSLSCRKGHAPCWAVRVVARAELDGHHVQRWLGPYEHLTLDEALDVVGTIAVHESTRMELQRRIEDFKSRQMMLDFNPSSPAL